MSKWKCEICGNEFENFHARGFDNKIYCPLCYFKKKYKQLKDNWNKLKEYIGTEWYCFDNESVEFEVAKDILNKMQELEGSDSNVED